MRAIRFLKAVLSATVLLLILLGTPSVLSSLLGSPLPDHIPALDEVMAYLLERDDGALFMGFLRIVAWGAWLAFTLTVISEILARGRGRRLPLRLPGLGWMQWLAAGLIAAITFAGGTSVASAVPPSPVVAAAPLHPLSRPEPSPPRTVVVQRGDTLSAIAEHKLGSARRWPKIWKLNAHRHQADGSLFRDPDLIHPGWKLRLPVVRPQPRHDATSTATAVPTPPQQVSKPENQATRVPARSSQVAVVVEVPGGGLVSGAFAAGITTAWVASRLWRRRGHRAPQGDEPILVREEPEPEPAVGALRREQLKHLPTEERVASSDHDLVRSASTSEIPLRITVGKRADHSEAALPLAGLNLGVTGSGAEDVVRSLVIDLLRQADHYRAEIIIPEAQAVDLLCLPLEKLRRLIDAEALPGLRLASTPEEAYTRLEEMYLTRGRIMFEREVDDIAALRAADPGDVLPAVLLVAALDERPNRRLESLLRLAEPYGIGGLLLGHWPSGTACEVDTDAQVIAVEGESVEVLRGASLFHVTPDHAAQFVRVIASSHGVEEALSESARQVAVSQSVEQPEIEEPSESPPISLLLLGAPEVWVNGKLIPLARREKAFELLVYLALHPGTTRKQLMKVLWPGDFPGDFHSTLRHLRDPLKQASGLKDKLFIRHDNDRYSIMPELIDVDVWRFQRLLAKANAAEDGKTRITALEEISRLCGGAALEGVEFDWRDREAWPLDRAMADALVQLARLHEEERPHRAVQLWERALVLDPDSEETYRGLIALQWKLGRRVEARRMVKELQRRFAAFGAAIEEETAELLARVRQEEASRLGGRGHQAEVNQ